MGRAFWGDECSDDRLELALRFEGKFAYACVLAESGNSSSNSACRSIEGASVLHEFKPCTEGASVLHEFGPCTEGESELEC